MTAGASRNRRLVYVLERFPADTLNFVYNEIRVLEQEGWEVEIHSLLPGTVCPAEAADFADRTQAVRPVSGGRILRSWLHYLLRRPFALLGLCVRLPLDNSQGRGRKFLRTFGHLAIAVHFAWLLRGRRDHIHAHFAFKAATAALVAARLNGTGFSFTAHGSATVYPPKQHSLRSKIRGARFVVAVSEYNKRVMLGLCPEVAPERIEVNRTGILLDQFPPRDAEPSAAGPLRIICIASYYPVKNHRGLLKACGELQRREVDFRLELVGKDIAGIGPELRALAAAEGIAGRVVEHGSVDHGEIADLLAGADVCILTSFSEGVPVSLMEAMARGVCVVGPRVTGVPELVGDGDSGLLADPQQPAEFADALERLAREPDLRRNLAAAGRRVVEAEYDMVANARRLAGIFAARLG